MQHFDWGLLEICIKVLRNSLYVYHIYLGDFLNPTVTTVVANRKGKYTT